MSERQMGEAKPGAAWTRVHFLDGSTLLVCWDGRHEVAGIHGDPVVTVYQPGGRRLHIPLHRIDMIEHQESTP